MPTEKTSSWFTDEHASKQLSSIILDRNDDRVKQYMSAIPLALRHVKLPIEIPSMILKGIKTRYFSPLPISSSSFNSNYINPLSPLKITIAPLINPSTITRHRRRNI